MWLTPERADKLDRIRGDTTRAEALRGLLDRAEATLRTVAERHGVELGDVVAAGDRALGGGR